MGSAGIGQPFKVLQQYLIHIGKEVEILTKEGKKLEGVLKDANEENFTVTIEKKVKPEGAKRDKLVEKIEKAQEELGVINEAIEGFEAPIKTMTGGFGW